MKGETINLNPKEFEKVLDLIKNSPKMLTEEQRKARKVFDKLINMAIVRGHFIAYPDGKQLKDKGAAAPEICFPGALVKRLSEEERESLKYLDSEYVRNYIKGLRK